MSLFCIDTALADPAVVTKAPDTVPEFANANRIQSRPAVPNALLLIVIDEVAAPVLVMPVTLCAVEPVAHPRSVLLLRLVVAPVAELLAPTSAVVLPVVEVSIPLLVNGPPETPVVVV